MPTKKTPFDFANFETPSQRLFRETAGSQIASLGVTSELQRTIEKIVSPSRGVLDSSFLEEATRTQKLLSQLGKPFGGIAALAEKLSVNERLLSNIASVSDVIKGLETAKATQWAGILAGTKLSAITSLYSNMPTACLEATRLHEQAVAALGANTISRFAVASSAFEGSDQISRLLADTGLKMSVLAGIEFQSGLNTQAFNEACAGLLGSWRTTPQLPETFWLDAQVREKCYREAEVDPGLIVAPPSATLEVIVESGFAGGEANETEAVAIIAVGSTSLSIRARTADIDAHSAVMTFERQLRGFISKKLENIAGPKWAKQRLPASIHTKAKETRAAALRAGEKTTCLIDFTDFGELKEIILRRDNWEEAFGEVFISRGRFEQDMLTLLALRRPSAHSRTIDSPRLVEALCVMQRLDALITDDGGWRQVAESDD